MTLRVRLLSLTLSMVAIVALTLVALDLNSLAVTSLDVVTGSSEMAARQLQSFILRRLASAGPRAAPGMAEIKRSWQQAIATDPDIASLLEQSMAQSRSIVEIDIAGEDAGILASSNPRQRGMKMRPREDLSALRSAGPLDRLVTLLTSREDYETRVPLGIEGQKTPLLTIQILVSPVLLRAATYPQMSSMLIASGLALVLAFLLAWWAAHVALRPLARIGHIIDDIAAGKEPESRQVRQDEVRELAVIESKLSILGERYRGAREDATQLRSNLEGVLGKLDVETRRQFESQIALARRLAAINSLTGRVAHEIKNPLNSIALRLEILRSRMAEESPGSEAEFAVLSEEVTRLDRVVRTFLDFNRPVELVLEDVDLAEEAVEILRLLEPETEGKEIVTSCDRPAEPILVKADAGLLRQALLNIAVNAIEAMEKGGRLTVAIARQNGACSIRIANTGPPIPPEQLDKVFQLYFTTKPRGTGIGLAMTFRAVQLHGGTIEVENEAGRGVAFSIALPLPGMNRFA
jgi:signal transduction histidine kinase